MKLRGSFCVLCYSCMYSIMKPGMTCTTVFGFQLGGSTYKNLEKSSVYAGLRGSYFFKETGYLIDKLSIIPYTFITENIKSKGELL